MNVLIRSIKYFLIFLALVLVALLAFAATFDANNYKPQIIEQVEKTTGRTFTINGDINLSVFPWVGLKVEDVSLGNDKGFKAEQFAAIKRLDVKVNVLPLLRKEVEVNTIRLHGLNVSLEVAENSANNWSSLVQAEAEAGGEVTATEKTQQPVAEKESALSLQSLRVEGFEFVDAMIRYDDRSSKTSATVSELNLTTSAIAFDEPVDIKFGARIENSEPAIDTRLTLTTQLTFDQELTRYTLRDLVFIIIANANEFIPQQEQVEIRSSIDVSMDEQRVVLKQLQLSALGTTTLADITVSQFKQTPIIQGGIEVQPFNARDVAKRVAVELPMMAKADALHHVAIKTKIKLQGEKLQANDFNLTLDSSTLSGWLHVIDISKQKLRYDLSFDQLDINDYMPPVAEAVEQPEVVAGTGSGAPAVDATTGDETIELPVEMMRKLDIEGDFKIASLTAKDYQIKQFQMTTKAREGVIDIKPLAMQVLQGQVNTAVNVNVQKAIPAYAIDLKVNQVQAGPVVDPFLVGIMGDKPLTMEGAVNLTMDVKTTGETVNQLKQASKGQIILNMKETAVNGFDPEFYMRTSVANYVDSKGFGMSKTIMGNYRPREVTVFDKIFSTVNLADGKARTDDFLMSAERVQVTAKGHVDIMQDTVDMMSSVALPRGKTAIEKILDKPIFIRIHGPFDALEYDLDKDRLKESTTDVLQDQAKAKIDAEKQRLKAKAEAEKQRLKDKADAEKRRAEERAKEELKKHTDKYEDKLKDKLKGLF